MLRLRSAQVCVIFDQFFSSGLSRLGKRKMNKLHLSTLFLILLLFLVACGGRGGDAQESDIQESPAEETEIEEEAAPEEEAAEEAIEEPPLAIGSEDDSGALPPPINSGSKVTATSQASGEAINIDVLFIIELSADTAVSFSELETDWEDTRQQIGSLSAQPEARYASILFSQELNTLFNVTDFTTSLSWNDLATIDDTDNNVNNFTETVAQLSWTEEEMSKIVFILVSPSTFDETLLSLSDNAIYYPIIAQDLDLSEEALLDYETVMDGINGRLIQLESNTQTTLSEQLILAVAEAITQTDE